LEKLKKNDILIIDYGVGNHLSVENTLSYLGYTFSVSCEKRDISRAQAYILPGVGAFNEAMKNLKKLDLINLLNDQVLIKKKPILGICLGMQIMANDSEEKGLHTGLGWIKGHVKRIPSNNIRIPHVGWNQIEVLNKEPLFEKLDNGVDFYFDHSFYFHTDRKYQAAICQYGHILTAAIQYKNIFGVQFHPEKSQNNGLKLFRGFFNYIQYNKGK
jgi:glutamine amidotransferase